MAAMTDTPRDPHPRVDLPSRQGANVYDILSQAIAESPDGVVRVHYADEDSGKGELTALDATGCLTTWNLA